MIQTKKYLVLDLLDNPNHEQLYVTPTKIIKPRIVTGFLRSEVKQAMTVSEGWVPQPSDKLFFFPGCIVPRFKVREKYTVTIKPENATVAFINKDGLTGSDSTFKHYNDLMPITRPEANRIIEAYMDSNRKVMLKSILDNPTIEQIFLSKEWWSQCMYTSTFLKEKGEQVRTNDLLESVRKYIHESHCTESQYQLLAYVPGASVNSMNCPIYLQDEILKQLNTGNLIINEKKYRELRAFGETGDKDNIVLMMELMANSDYEKSVAYLIFLLREFGQKICQYSEVDHVNFKSLLNFLDIPKTKLAQRWAFNVNYITTLLKKHKAFTKNNVMILTSLCANDSIGDNDSCPWQSGISLKPTFYNTLDKDENDD